VLKTAIIGLFYAGYLARRILAESKGLTGCEPVRINTAFGQAGAFLMGAVFSAMVGFIGMNMMAQGSVRTAAAAVDTTRGCGGTLLSKQEDPEAVQMVEAVGKIGR
jgi:hypothetical protein